MFWIGLIVGAVVGIALYTIFAVWRALRVLDCSLEEFFGMCGILVDTADNRESTLACVKDDEILSEYALVER